MIIHENSAVRAPETLSDEEASTLPIAAVTAWFSLIDYGELQPGQTVLVKGTGGVSIFAVQLASAYGAHVIVTSSRDENLQKVKVLGAWEGINYERTPAWDKRAQELTDGKGVDLLLDVVGGDGLNQCIAATKVAGHISQIGFLGGQTANIDLMQLHFRQTTIRGIAVGHRKAFERLNLFINEHKIKPVIDHVYPLSEAIQAYQHLARGAFGRDRDQGSRVASRRPAGIAQNKS